MRDPDHQRSVVFLLLTSLCWSLAGVLFKIVDWPPFAAAGARGLVAALFLLALRGKQIRFTWSPLQLGAAVAYAGCTILFAAANKLTTAANAILLQYTAPIWVALLGFWLLGERARRTDWLTILASFAGMALFLYEGLRLNHLGGIALAALSGVCFAIMAILFRKQKDSSPLGSVVLGNFLGFLVGLPAMLSAGHLPNPTSVAALLALGTVQLGIPYLLYSSAIKHVTALEAVLLPVIEPILNPIWVAIFVGETPSGLALAGGAIVLAAALTRAVLSLREERPAA